MTRSLPSLAQLEAFEATARLGAVSRAAEALNLTQSAVSRQILALEASLGVPLFARVRKRLILTEAGGAYLEEIGASLAGLEAATRTLRAARGRGGTLSLAVLPTFATAWLTPRLGRFHAAHPQVRLKLSTRLEPFDFAYEPFDGAIHFGAAAWPGAVTEFLAYEEMAAVAAPDLAAGLTSAAAVAAAPLIQTSTRPFAWREWFEALGESAPTLSFELQVDTFAMAVEAVASGLGAAVLPLFAVAALVESGRLTVVQNLRLRSASAYYLAYPADRRAHYPMRAFRTWIQEELAQGGAGLLRPPSSEVQARAADDGAGAAAARA